MPAPSEELSSPFLEGESGPVDHEQGPSGAYLIVVDETGRPLEDGEYQFYQEGVSSKGRLTAGGRALFGRVNPAQEFRFAVSDRVCSIQAGAYLNPDRVHMEYGGTWFDWRLVRDDKKPHETFWPEYQRAALASATPTRFAVDRFLQHEHVTRRPIQLTKESIAHPERVTIRAVPPEIRVGPFVRYADHERAVIWVETVTPCLVRVRYRVKGGVREFARASATVRVGGRYFGIVELEGLSAGLFHEYTLDLAPLPASGVIPTTSEAAESAFPVLTGPVRDTLTRELKQLSLSNSEWLRFRALRAKYEDRLSFATGSCRWYPSDLHEGQDRGPDMLVKLGVWLARTPDDKWPQFLFLSGDQIYADEVGDDHAKRTIEGRFAARIPGPDEKGSAASKLVDGAWGGRFAHRYKPYVNPTPSLQKYVVDGLAQIAAIHKKHPEIGEGNRLNAGESPKEKRRRVYNVLGGSDHQQQKEVWATLTTLAELEMKREPWRAYLPHWQSAPSAGSQRRQLLCHNFLLWSLPDFEHELPSLKSDSPTPHVVGPNLGWHPAAAGGVHAADFAEYASHYERAWVGSPSVRKLLAHVPTFLMFDDHEVTDDWNFDLSWVRMLHNPRDEFQMWPKTLTDALAAYWIYQGYCNKAPSQWSAKDPRVEALRHAKEQGMDALPALRRLIHRECFPRPDAKAREFQAGTNLVWHYRLPFDPPFLVPDCRSRKRLVAADEGPRIIDHGSSSAPRSETIDAAQRAWLRDELIVKKPQQPIAFVAPSTPLLLVKKAMDFMLRPETVATAWANGDWGSKIAAVYDSTRIGQASDKLLLAFRRGKDLEHMIRDKSWRDLWNLVEELGQEKTRIKTLVLVSGDVHHSYCMKASIRGAKVPTPEVLQITCSGLQTTIRADALTDKMEDLSRGAFDIGRVHLEPGFISKEDTGDPDVALFKNSVALVQATWAKELRVRVEFRVGPDAHFYDYKAPKGTAAPSHELGAAE